MANVGQDCRGRQRRGWLSSTCPIESEQEAREGARAATDVEHAASREFLDHGGVRIEIASGGVQRIVDLGQSRKLEDWVGHAQDRSRSTRYADRPVSVADSPNVGR